MIQEAFARMSGSVTQHMALALLHFLWQGMLVVLVLAWSTAKDGQSIQASIVRLAPYLYLCF